MSSTGPIAAALRVALCALLLGVTLGGCAHVDSLRAPKTPKEKGERLYFDGLEYLHGGGFLEAQAAFTECLKLPAYLQVTSLARLRLGDTYFYQRKFSRAIEQYETFARRHDGSSNVPYARFMVAKSHYGQVPTDFWLLPPIYEMDLSAADKARYHLEQFIGRYPLSVYATEAAQLREQAIDLQLAHHSYVIRFYTERKRWLGVVFRLHYVMEHFPRRGHSLANYVLLQGAYRRLDWRRRALELGRAIGRRWPTSPQATLALGQVAELRNEIARGKAAGDPAAEMPVEVPPTARFRPEG